ncbi:hypothetical protein [Pseudomonas rubra]|uniref:Uncharacterized protein n=1 Tax=Pseudomonas rubra TaxID=2942627 RepID=A0ABT5PFR0_9PSED|nr:hypothetical protein [Pseudomonas rubra]MDD1017032.1 hypothetical protein [Pseudomonas rubra]MDD1041023.1 hypothetical protein [Pseudomonas rubra]MDD1157570.1 hypothetical protein [Pseudomonas rubra]
MSDVLSEQEMRAALFGTAINSVGKPDRLPESKSQLSPFPQAPSSKPLVSRLRVTLHVTKVYEGAQELFVHDVNTLSSLVAEAEAKAAAKKKKFRYFELVSIKPVQV